MEKQIKVKCKGKDSAGKPCNKTIIYEPEIILGSDSAKRSIKIGKAASVNERGGISLKNYKDILNSPIEIYLTCDEGHTNKYILK